MRKIFAFAMLLLAMALPVRASLSVGSLRIGHLNNPEGYVSEHPSFSWVAESSKRGGLQTAYQIRLYEGRTLVWDSGKVASDNSITVPYSGPAFKSGTRYFWKVRIWDNSDQVSPWSEDATFLTGIFEQSQWKAQWVETDSLTEVSPRFRKEFVVRGKVRQAVLNITSRGLYEATINGIPISADKLTPGWTSYEKRLQYQSYDVTSLVKNGRENVLGVILGYGWYKSELGWRTNINRRPYSGKNLALLSQLQITYTDGRVETIATDDSWRCTQDSQILFSEIYHGETIDANLIDKGWDCPGYDDSAWAYAKVKDYGTKMLIPTESENVRIMQWVNPVRVLTTPAGEKVVDFGQNLVGFESLSFMGAPGQHIRITHAEVLDEKGNFYTTNLRSARAESNYFCSGGNDLFQPRFTFYGFRYIRVEGIEGELDPAWFRAAVVRSSYEEHGRFVCSDTLVNKLQSNILWGMRGNFVDIPTDCPQRDERLGWSGDAQVFFRTATFNGRVQNFFAKWMKDVTADMRPNGAVPNVIPDFPNISGAGRTGWADVATVIPWQHYMAYGDPQILRDQYETMKKWVGYMEKRSRDGLWSEGSHYGDWLFYSVSDDRSGKSAVTLIPLIQQCYFALSADILARSAAVLGFEQDAARYAELASSARKAFCEAYLTPRGMLVSSTQTAYVLALAFDMVPPQMRPLLAGHLHANVKKYGHITTGFLGTPHICNTLTDWGYSDDAYSLLLYPKCPGWLYQVSMGATTMWERWNSMLPDGSIPDNGMNSFNHYSFGAIGDWLYRGAAGLRETSPGFKTMEFYPHPGGGFTDMSVSRDTPYGRAAAAWKIVDSDDGKSVGDGGKGVGLVLSVEIPFNTTAEVYVPCPDGFNVLLDGAPASGVQIVNGLAHMTLGSGKYAFKTVK